MKLSYKKLFKLLIDKDIKKMQLSDISHVSMTSIAKLGQNKNVNTEVLEKICTALNCDIGDICEMVEEQ